MSLGLIEKAFTGAHNANAIAAIIAEAIKIELDSFLLLIYTPFHGIQTILFKSFEKATLQGLTSMK